METLAGAAMKVLGLSSHYHDASAALVVDGVPVAAAAEERFTRQKHDPVFPERSARFCLEQAGLRAEDLDLVAYHEEPEVKFARSLAATLSRWPSSGSTFVRAMTEAVSSGLWVRRSISAALEVPPSKIVCVPHHLSHAAHAFLTSPFEDAAVLTVDAVGEWTSTGVFDARRQGGGAAIEPVGLVAFPHSLGLVYSAFTAFLGFEVNDAECSTMALAAFGEPRYADAVRRVVRPGRDGAFEVDPSYFDLSGRDDLPVTGRFLELFGAPRPFKRPLPFDCLADAPVAADADDRRWADVAASVQAVLEERVLALAEAARRRTGRRRLCLAGGVAQNCVANGRLADAGIFEDIYVPPDPGDGGGAMGAALHAHLAASGSCAPISGSGPYLGKAYDEAPAAAMFERLDPQAWQKYRRAGASTPARRVRVRRFADDASAVEAAADLLASGRLIGWAQGRFENGPRALGNRSILCDPGNVAAARRLSAAVKQRASFRPYAFAIADDEAGLALEGSLPRATRWMQISRRVRMDMRARVRAAVHADGSTRPQICGPADNPLFHSLLKSFGRRKGLSALLNTSFNEKGMPISSSPDDALLVFARTDLDALFLGRTLVAREGS
ncbi:MAG: carbamoyl transferase [Elusimicrobia bacterium]|nr:carbamoyl transferase [Elusimicrobiota bacterium]